MHIFSSFYFSIAHFWCKPLLVLTNVLSFLKPFPCARGSPGRGDLQPQLDSAMQDVTDMCLLMEEMEKQAVRRALVEERGRFCTFISFLQPVVVRRKQAMCSVKTLLLKQFQ